MKHVRRMSKTIPAKAAILPEEHPSVEESLKGLFQDPIGTITQHFDKGEVA